MISLLMKLIKRIVLLTKIKKRGRKLYEELNRLKEKQACKLPQFMIASRFGGSLAGHKLAFVSE